ncbi:MAG: PIN domain-containing protein [Vicinamibacterales bacterium]
MVLVDTSVWIEVFRRGSRVTLDNLVDFDDLVTCLPVIQEVLQGFDDEQAFAVARESLQALPIVESPMPAAIFDDAADLYRRARRGGVTVRSSVDCLIAACAIRHRFEVLHLDRDFDALARVSALRSRRAKIRKS